MGEPIIPTTHKFHTELTEYSVQHGQNTGPYAPNLDVDVLIVGAGFSGVFMLKTLRDRGFKTVIYEAGNDTGGTWRWNCYPGARVDSEVPEYEYSWPEVYKTWNWTENYPSYKELRAYFDHVDKVIGIKKDCSFNTVVVSAKFCTDEGKWTVKTADGRVAKSKFLILGAGFAAKRYIPDWPGMDKFKGVMHHSSFWPDEGVDVKGKRVAVIGTGASGVQIVQEWGPDVGEMKVFQRTPNLALPMCRRTLTVEEQEKAKNWYYRLFQLREKNFAGFLYTFAEKNTFDDTPEERQAFFEELWKRGGFNLWLGVYKDMISNPEANKKTYEFWSSKVRDRVGDPRKRDLLAPVDMPHYFGVKRPCLENNYYEQFNRPNVDVVDIRDNGIKEFDETGLILADGTHYEFDVIAIATGFDITTGGMTQMGLESIHNTTLKDEWASSANTYLGTTVSGYPNMFHMYGPHGPTLLSNGPTTIEVQGRWIADCIGRMKHEGLKYINPTTSATQEWKARINAISDATLLPTTRSTYMGGSVPGKAFEQVNYAGGIPQYQQEIRAALDGWKGFDRVEA